GADAMISYPEGVKSVSALDDDRVKVVLTEGSPSETLFRAVRDQFDLKRFKNRPKAEYLIAAGEQGAADVYEQFLKADRTDRKGFVLWEPYVSLAREQGAQVLVDSSQFKGVIVDVLVVQHKYLTEHPDRVETVMRTYLDLLNGHKASADGMADLVQKDAKIIK